ncbi:AMP-binding protein [Amycolatopsis sp. SID8362]|uniref:AMP-binding protein n=1 Tax=Amycolatopsis sp. SID8362 TaxID=2690346 RepID=UPI00136E120F|nr:AMP-binding protein [Amycolatopsis sp. SID8362]NBH08567.1 AMP-binding protein [Amycolatopsis sp. SID8362]NED45261.1 AMP-binding protein [Amycolatopsis sp. SID8362]
MAEPSPQTAGDLFAVTAARFATAVAVVGAEEELTYETLLVRVDALRDRLRGHGARPGHVVAVLLPKHDPDCVITALAIWRCGATLLAVDPALPPARREVLLTQAGARVVVRRTGDDLELSVWDHPARFGEAAYLIYTSGSTGTPKPVLVGHRALLAIHRAWEQVYGLETRTYLQVAGLSFDVFVADLARTLLSGGKLVLCPTETTLDPPELVDLAATTGADSVELTPSVLRLLTTWAQRHRARLNFSLVVAGGEQWRTGDLAALRAVTSPGTRIVNTYGITETTIDTTYLEVTGPGTGPVVPIGRPFPGVVVAVLDENLRPVPEGDTGELYVAGPTLADGYAGLPDETARRFVPSAIGGSASMYRTGDLVRTDRSGQLVVVGRVDEEVKLHGVRVHPGEVESLLSAECGRWGLDAVVVVDRADTVRLRGFIAAGGRPVAHGVVDRVWQALSDRLPAAIMPTRIEVVERFPLTGSGKVDRAALAAWSAPPLPERTGPVEPVAAAVHAAWHAVLGFPPNGTKSDLFASGADSLAAARVAAAIGERLDVRLSVADVLAARTVGALVELAAAAERDSASTPAAPVSREFPATTAQSALWLLDRLDRDDPSYHLPTVLEIDGVVDVPALHRALATVVRRHEALRCSFGPGRDGAVVHVADECEVPLPVDLCSPAEATSRISALVAEPIDLTRAPLVRARLLRLGPERHVFVLVVPHIVFDGWSESVLLDELDRCYTAELTGQPAALTAACALPRTVQAPTAASLAFWRRKFEGWTGPPVLAEPGPVAAAAPHRARARLSVEQTRAVRVLATSWRTTPYTVMFAALAVLIARRGGRTDVVLGTPLGARTTRARLRSIGFQVTSVPVRLTVPDRESFQDVVTRVRAELIEAFTHADAGLPDIVGELGLAGSGRRNPLFSQWFNWLGEPARPRLAGLDVRRIDPAPAGALFDSTWYVTEDAESFTIELVTAADAFAEEETGELLDQYVLLLDQFSASPARAVCDADLHTYRGRAVLPAETADLRTDPPDLGRELTAALSRNPEAPTVFAPDGMWTAGELAAHSDRLAGRLRDAGVRAGDVVPIHTGRCGALVVAVLAVLRAGARFMLLDAHQPPRWLVAQASATSGPAGIAAGPNPSPEVRATRAHWLSTAGEAAPAPPPASGAAGYVLFTSGTTGSPRGVLGGPAAISNFLTWYRREHRVGASDRVAMLSGLSHDPLLRDILLPLVSGAGCRIPPDELLLAPNRLLRWLRDSAVTIAHVTPALGRALAGATDTGPVPSLRLVLSAGDLLSGADAAAIRTWAPHARVVNGYGTTETPQLVAMCDADPAARPGARLAVGSGVPGAQLLIRTRTGRPAAIGEPGEIVVRSPYLAEGSIGEPLALEADPVAGHRRYRTGDLGRFQADGTVVVLGRGTGDQRSIQGHRVELGEIEAAVRSLDGVHDAAAEVYRGPDGSTLVVAYLVRDPAARDDDACRARLRTLLPAHCTPTRFVEVAGVPRTRNGKIDRAALTDPGPVAASAGPESDAPDPVERAVHDVWCGLLRRPRVPLDANLFDLGASSLTMLTAHSALEHALDTDLEPTVLFQFPTIRSLATHLHGDPRRPATRARRSTDLLDRRRAARGHSRRQEGSR